MAEPTDEIQVYDASIAEVGMFNLTWHNNYTASGPRASASSDGIGSERAINGVTEWAYGVTPWFEAGLYLPLYSIRTAGGLSYNGFKLRTLFVVPDAGKRSFFYGMNFEYSGNTRHWNPKTFTAEVRPIVGWRLGPLDFIVNPILDYDSAGARSLDFAPATRLALHVDARWAVGLEEYSDFGPLHRFLAGRDQSHQLFAVIDRTFGKLSLEAGCGYGFTPGSDRVVLKLILSRDLR